MSIGVGIIGAGPVTQAIHIPTLARLSELYRIEHIMDVSPDVAESVAGRVGARWSTTLEELLADPAVDVVAICSPHAFHAQQVEAAITAGVKGILCEKPFAVSEDEAERLAAVAGSSGTPLLVGAMHTFDPGWTSVTEAWGDLAQTAHTVRSSIVLPMNDRFEDLATQIHSRPAGGGAARDFSDNAVRTDWYRNGILGLAIHNLPLIRRFLPVIESIEAAEMLEPYGYAVTLHGEDRTAELIGHMHHHWRSAWTFDVWSDDAHLHIDFTPSYVQAGSSTATLTTQDGTRTFGPYPSNGYEQEWIRLSELVTGETQQPAEQLQSFIDDLGYAFQIANATPQPERLNLQEVDA